MKILRFLPILFLFIFAACSQEKDTVVPTNEGSKSTARLMAAPPTCEFTTTNTPLTRVDDVLEPYLNCVTGVCEYARRLSQTTSIFITGPSDPSHTDFTPAQMSAFVATIQTSADAYLNSTVKGSCPSAMIGGYDVIETPVPQSNGSTFYLYTVTVSYVCCDGKPEN